MTFRSMTGFGSVHATKSGLDIGVELKSVNHRFLDVNCKLPAQYSQWESDLVRVIKEKLKRGRVEVYVTRVAEAGKSYEVQFNESLFQKYLEIAKKALQLGGISAKESAMSLIAGILERREVVAVVVPEIEVKTEQEMLTNAFRSAVEQLVAVREVEGKALATELLQHLGEIEKLVQDIAAGVKDAPTEFKRRLTERLAALAPGVEVDPQRLATEVAILADKVDVSEEIARLKSHCDQFRGVIKKAEGGKKLDFFIQEMNREINTIGSKAQNSAVTHLVVDAKTLLEKLREQVQNVE